METFELPVSLRIRGTPEEIFSAWIDPSIAKHWLCDQMTGQWRAGESVFWHFGEIKQELRIQSITPHEQITFRWLAASGAGPDTTVQIQFRLQGDEVGLILRETSWPLTKENVTIALDHACGWENVFCRLKAWTEAKVKLR